MTTETPLQFEAAYERLEKILEEIQAGKVSLEDSLKLYEEADRLIQWCNKSLCEAEARIEVLVKNREGGLQLTEAKEPQTAPFSPSRTQL